MILTTFYKTVMDRVLDAVPEVKYFDMFNDQFNNESDELPFEVPAVFIEILPIEWMSLGRKAQEAEVDFNIHIGTESLSETSNLETDKERNAGLYHLQLADKVFTALHGLTAQGIGSISRRGTIPDNNHGQGIVTIIPFKCRLFDDFAIAATIPATPTLDLEQVMLPEQA